MMSRKKRRLLCVLCALGLMSAAAGCGEKSPLDPKNPTTITVWTYYNGDQLSAFDNLVDDFNVSVVA